MSFTSNGLGPAQWTTGGDDSLGYTTLTGTSMPGYDHLSQIPITTTMGGGAGAFVATAGVDMASSATLFDPMYSLGAGTSANAAVSYDTYYQYTPGPGPGPDGTVHLSYDGHPYGPTDQHPDARYDDAGGSHEEGSSRSKKKGKKRSMRHFTPDQVAKRREQNRKAQRTYRDRKDQRIKELEEQLAFASQQTEMINSAMDALRAEHAALTGSSTMSYPAAAYGVYPPVTGV